VHLTDGDERSVRKKSAKTLTLPWGVFETTPRSYVTRDLALLEFLKLVGAPIPARLDEFFRDQAGVDPEGELSRFRMGPEWRDLERRVVEAKRLGAVAYVPTDRTGDDAPAG
jgi:hypothetical protein